MNWIRRDERRDPYDRRSLLHVACRESGPRSLPNLATLRLLLRAGADPDSSDKYGDRPLHALAKTFHKSIDPAACLLLDSGAYLSRVNKEGKTAFDVMMDFLSHYSRIAERFDLIEERLKDSWIRGYDIVPKLKFQSGRVVRFSGVPYLCLPPTLYRFIELHHK